LSILYQPSELDFDDTKLFGNSIASEWIIEEELGNFALSKFRREKNYL
jgi:hypothetical protein